MKVCLYLMKCNYHVESESKQGEVEANTKKSGRNRLMNQYVSDGPHSESLGDLLSPCSRPETLLEFSDGLRDVPVLLLMPWLSSCY